VARPIRLAIVDDYEVVVRGLSDMLRSYTRNVKIVQLNANTGVTGEVDIALYDTFAQPRGDGSGVRELAANPRITKVVVYTWSFDREVARASLAQGAAGYLSKTLTASALVEGLQRIHGGQQVISQDPGRSPITTGDWPGREEGLTAREAEVLALITQGLSNDDIVRMTHLSINSIKSYIRSCYRKIGVTNRSNAILWGVEHGFKPDRARVVGLEAQPQA
jgi:NarL family two-component system response regulator LiaR